MRQLITCPRCKLDNREKILGELLGAGTVAIARQRSKYSYEESTIVIGNDFSIVCGYCRTIIQIRKEEHESSNLWITRVHWIAFGQGTIKQEYTSSENTSGTTIQSERLEPVLSNGKTGLHLSLS